MKLGKHRDALEKLRETQHIPMLDNAPELHWHLALVWEIWQQADKGRQGGFNGPQRLAWSEILVVIQLYGITDLEEVFEIIELVQHLDTVYIEWLMKT